MSQDASLPVLEVDLGPGIGAFFTSRAGGVSRGDWAGLNLGTNVADDPADVRANRALVDARAGAPVSYGTQVHGARVAVRTEVVADSTVGVAEVDGLVTSARGLPLGVYVADCVPVLLADPTAGVVAIAHAGRPGVEHGVVPATVRAMVGAGATAANIRAVLGPSVCAACYEVPEDLHERVVRAVPEATGRTSWGTPSLDLPGAVLAQLASAGVDRTSRIERCTRTDERYYSHRRATENGTSTGRFAGVVTRW